MVAMAGIISGYTLTIYRNVTPYTSLEGSDLRRRIRNHKVIAMDNFALVLRTEFGGQLLR